MPPTTVHDRITLLGAAALLPAGVLLPSENRYISAACLTGSFLLSGLLFSCDLDVDSTEYRRWGPLRFLWFPYKRMVLHRSWLSHGLVIGPLVRLIYFVLFVDLLVALGTLGVEIADLGGLAWLSTWHGFWFGLAAGHMRFLADFLIGFVLGGAAHTIPDRLVTGVKRLA